MTSNLLFAVGTLADWFGMALVIRTLYLLAKRQPGVGVSALFAGGSLLVAAMTPALHGHFGLPLIWVVMPFSGWAVATVGLLSLVNVLRYLLERTGGRLKGIAVSGVLLLGAVWLLRTDPEAHFDVLSGKILLSVESIIAIFCLALAAIGIMAFANREMKKLAARFVIHVTLLCGCVVFGLPFAWLMITSFKEDRDMASPNGLVWIPKVQKTVPYLDPEEPVFQGDYHGNRVEAATIGRNSDGSYITEVRRPASLAGMSINVRPEQFRIIPNDAPVVAGKGYTAFVTREMSDGRRQLSLMTPASLKGTVKVVSPDEVEPVREVGLRTRNYTDALESMPVETQSGLLYLRNTLLLVVLSVFGTVLSSSLVAYGFARLRFPGREPLFKILLATMMLPGAVTLMPQFLLFRWLGWIDTLLPLWVPAFFGGAFNVFLLRQFLVQIPLELEDASRIDGAGILRTFWTVMLPQVKPALAVVAIWTFMGAWNSFMGPLIYINSPENMPLAYALQLFQTERGGEAGMMMAFASLTILPVVALFFFAQRYFIEGITFSGFGGR